MTGYESKKAMAQDKLAQPAQEPVALVIDGVLVKSALPEKYTGHLYTTPPQRPWVDLTPQDLNEIFAVAMTGEHAVHLASDKLKEKNNG